MSAKLFAIELVHFTISCSNSTWTTRPFIVWLSYPCLGCSVLRRTTKPSIIWPCHSFISYSFLQLIFRPALYLLIYLRSLYFWWWRPPIQGLLLSAPLHWRGMDSPGDLTATQERSLAAHRAARWWFRCKPGPFFNPSRIVETISLYIHRREAHRQTCSRRQRWDLPENVRQVPTYFHLGNSTTGWSILFFSL